MQHYIVLDFYFYFGNTEQDVQSLTFLQIRELNTKNCFFEHNVIDIKSFVKDNSKLSMVNNGTGSCRISLLNLEQRDVYFLSNYWTNSIRDVEIFNQNFELLVKFNKQTALFIENIYLNDKIYYIELPSESLTIDVKKRDLRA